VRLGLRLGILKLGWGFLVDWGRVIFRLSLGIFGKIRIFGRLDFF